MFFLIVCVVVAVTRGSTPGDAGGDTREKSDFWVEVSEQLAAQPDFDVSTSHLIQATLIHATLTLV